jgi:DNA repair protein RecO (recombination protein O)
MNYKKLTGIILKKQNYREADQIVSLWTREAGKVRVLGKSLRKPQSKLNYAMQDLAEVEISITGNGLPTLISAKPLQQFVNLCQDLKKMAVGFYAAELMLKMTADEHINFQAYDLLAEFLSNVNQMQTVEQELQLTDRFALELADVLGFGNPPKSETHHQVQEFIEDLIERKIKSEPFLISI